jgi:hypothetical protein
VLFIISSLDGVRHDKTSVRQQSSLHGLAEILDQAPWSIAISRTALALFGGRSRNRSLGVMELNGRFARQNLPVLENGALESPPFCTIKLRCNTP